jgi:hypothetical protein
MVRSAAFNMKVRKLVAAAESEDMDHDGWVAASEALETNMSAGGSPFRHSPVTTATASQKRNFTVAFTERFYAIVSKKNDIFTL